MTARPPEFDDTTGSWSSYRVRLEAFFEGRGITDPGKKRALLVSALSDHVVRVLQGQCQSESVNSLSYEVVIQHLDNHFDPKANEIAASNAFFMRNQAEGEKVRDYITDLRRLAKDWSFEKFLDRMLRDRIVCGIRDEQARRHMSQQKLSLAEVEAFSQAAEAAETNVRAMQERSFNDNGAANFVQKHRRNPQKSGRGHGSMTESTPRGRCGSNHGSEVCRHKKPAWWLVFSLRADFPCLRTLMIFCLLRATLSFVRGPDWARLARGRPHVEPRPEFVHVVALRSLRCF
ncbi:hypothetical protein V5799_003075 [Amblyomma americanum]|uniref:Retrotransposon gag domain-containing protein n=1 Tax=Amblyomma americanum TaxID=6943 RepID=A0AAQ4DA03_AMBAM